MMYNVKNQICPRYGIALSSYKSNTDTGWILKGDRMENEKHYRHEWKHIISPADLLTIRQRMRAVAKPDPHAKDGRYMIRSLYFDDMHDRALREKCDGVNMREKFRIRF